MGSYSTTSECLPKHHPCPMMSIVPAILREPWNANGGSCERVVARLPGAALRHERPGTPRWRSGPAKHLYVTTFPDLESFRYRRELPDRSGPTGSPVPKGDRVYSSASDRCGPVA